MKKPVTVNESYTLQYTVLHMKAGQEKMYVKCKKCTKLISHKELLIKTKKERES